MFERIKNYFSSQNKGVTIIGGCDEEQLKDYIRNPYSNPSFCMAMQKRCEATKNVKLGIFIGEGESKKELPKHKLAIMAEKLNANLSYADFIDYVLNWSIAEDNGCLIRKVNGLSWLNPDIRVYSPSNFNVYFDNFGINKIEIMNPHETISDPEEIKKFLWIKSANYYQAVAGHNPNMIGTGLSNQNAIAVIASFAKAAWS
ncbi:MAG: hypothetical protein ACRDAS_00585, partial [Cetobacterium sp.]